MNKKWVAIPLVALPLAIGGLVYATQSSPDKPAQEASQKGYICPLTGEELGCPNCCPLNQKAAE
jgi:hypothetical protein